MAIFNDDELYPSKYYNNQTFPVPNGQVIQLARAEREQVKNPQTGLVGPKLVLYFAGLEKGFICARPNYNAFVDAWGRDGDHWIGKYVVVGREAMASAPGGLRVRFTPMAQPTQPTSQPQPIPEEAWGEDL
jgi:hypothetical protein